MYTIKVILTNVTNNKQLSKHTIILINILQANSQAPNLSEHVASNNNSNNNNNNNNNNNSYNNSKNNNNRAKGDQQ